MKTREKFDVTILGGGPGGSTLGALLAKQGKSCAIIEAEEYPRFHIGESLLPFSMDIFNDTGVIEVLSSGKYIEKFGARFVDGVTEEEVYFEFAQGLDPNHPQAYEVPRELFDKDLLEWAAKKGARVYQPEKIINVEVSDSGVCVETDKRIIESDFVADVSGRDCILGKKFQIKKMNPDINNVGCFSHFKNVRRATGRREGDITIGLLEQGVWCWMIPFRGELTSVGVVCPAKVYREGDPESFLHEWFRKSEILTADMKNAERVRPVLVVSNYSHTCDQFYGDRWILVGDAAAFLDPIFSSGVHLSMTAATEASKILVRALNEKCLLTEKALGMSYEANYRKGVKRFHSLIRLFYDQPFVKQMKKALPKPMIGAAFTSALAGDVWNDENPLFIQGVL